MKTKTLSIILLLLISGFIKAQKISDWRPENRTGVSGETGLLKSWPEAGPQLIWTNLELKKGNSSVSFGTNTIFITGTEGDNDILYALDMNGKILWKNPMGRAWNQSYPESRATPVVEDNKVYTTSGYGDLACFDGTSGNIIWSYKGSELNKGTYGSWGIAESMLIDGDKVYYSPGGPETMTIALKKATGDVIWKSASIGDKPGYVSPILVNYGGKKMIINVSLGHVFAVDASNGDILWKISHYTSSDPNMAKWELIKCTTPLYKDGMVYVTGGYDTGGMMIKIGSDAKSASVAWTDQVLDDHHGGVVLINGYIYGSNWLNNSDGNWCCIEWATGKKMWEEHWKCKGSIIAAEGKLYIYDEKGGNVGLVNATPEKFDLVSTFKVTQGSSGPFWAHPVIHNGILYIRHTNALMAYKIKAE
jgi:outer membrane protein assembly factor BamB